MNVNRTPSVATCILCAVLLVFAMLPASLSATTSLATNVFLNDDFADGDLAGWANTADWINDAGELKHNLSGVSGTSSIDFPYAAALDLTLEMYQWDFCLRNGNWDPSGSNNFVVHLNNTAADFTGNGYAVGVNQTGSSDLLTLYRYDNGTATELIVSTFDWGESDDLCITVSRTATGEFELLYNNGTQISAGTATDVNHTGGTHFGLFFEFSSTRAGLLWLDDVSVQSCPAATSVTFADGSATVAEAAGTYDLCVDIAAESSTMATTVDVALTSGDAAVLNNYTTQTLTFPAASTAQQCVTLTFVDNGGCDGDQNFTFALQNVTGGMMAEIGNPSTFTLTVADDELMSSVLLAQSFEAAASDTWAYTAFPTPYSNADGDVWDIVTDLNGITPAAAANFWGMLDLDNDTDGGAFAHTLTFPATDVSGFINRTISFQYNADGYDAGDILSYEVLFDGTSQGDTEVVNASTTNDWQTEVIPVPDNVTTVSLILKATQNGNGDQAGFDDIQVNGQQCACTADAGDLDTNAAPTDFDLCLGEDLADAGGSSVAFIVDYAAADEENPGSLGNDYVFLLANADGTITDVSVTGDFDFSVLTTAGVYSVFGLSYATTNPTPAVNDYLNGITGDADMNDIAQIQTDDAGATLCLNLDGNDSAGNAVTVTLNASPTIASVSSTDPTTCNVGNGTITLTLANAEATPTAYTVTYDQNGTTQTGTLTSTESNGGSGDFDQIVLENLTAGSYDNFSLVNQTTTCAATSAETATLTAPGSPMPTLVSSFDPTTCGGNEGNIVLGNLTAGLMYTVNYMRDNLNVTAGPFTADAAGELILNNLIAANYNSINVTETISGCTGGNLNVTLTEPAAPTVTSPGTVTVCAPDAATYDLTQNEAAVTTDPGTFTWFDADPANGGTAIADPTSVAVADGELYFVTFTDATTNCEATTSLTISVFADAVITTQPAACTDNALTYEANFSVQTATNDAVTAVGDDNTDYTADLETTDNENYTIAEVPNGVSLTITVTRENNTCPPVTATITGIDCCEADAGDLLPATAQEICAGDDSPEFSIDYTAADETDPNPAMPTTLMISEIRIDQPQSGDPDEFFEIFGTPGFSLDGYTYLVIGDGAGDSGTIENATDLTGAVIPASGYFVAAMSGFTLGTADLTITNLNFENGDNVTHLLVQGFTGANGDDLDTDDDGVLDATPWAALIDDVALIEDLNTGEQVYSTNQVGPSGMFVPAHVYFSAANNAFLIGEFDPTDAAAVDSPGEANEMPTYITVYVVSEDNTATGGTANDIVTTQTGENNAPYATTFSGLAAGEYCINAVNFNGTEAEFSAQNFTTLQEIQDAIDAATICADLTIAECTPLTVTPVLTVSDVQEGDCTSLDAAGTFTVSFNLAGGVSPITINGEDVTDPAFSQGTITGTGTTADPFVFTSNDVQSNTAYSFVIADASATCSPDVTVAGIKDCDPCTGFAAPDDLEDVEGCEEETLTITPTGGGKDVSVIPTDLFISEYIEGSSNNKCLEIFNGTGADIDLTAMNYSVEIFANGNTTVSGSFALNGILADGEVFVVCNTSATATFTAAADLTTNQLNFNGDDAVVLLNNNTIIDIFGNIGCDPGGQWADGANSTQNMTLVRNAEVFAGIDIDPDNMPCTFPTLADEWTALPNDDASDLGSHTFSGMNALTVDYNYYDTDPASGTETPIATGASLQITDAIVPADGTPTTLFVTAFTTDPACESEAAEVTITRNPTPAAMPATLTECADGDGNADFFLENADAQINADATVTITYFATQTAAEDNTGAALTSPFNAAPGTVVFARVASADGCIATAELTLTTSDCEISIADPCDCRPNPANPGVSGNATTQSDGQFDEVVTVENAPSGQSWYIQTVVGLFDPASPQPPAAPIAFVTGPAGEMLVENPNGDGTSNYTLDGIHIDGQGYAITVTNGTDELSINNQCFYPTIQMSDAPNSTCLFTEPFTITGEEVNGGVSDMAGFTVFDENDNAVQTETGLTIEIDPMDLGLGTYTVVFDFDAGAAGSMDISDPGCAQMIEQIFEIEATPSQMSCNNLINISVGPDCTSEITPDMILEGNQGCEDDYEVQILNVFNQNLGNVTTPDMIGEQFTVRVFHLPTNNFCWGAIQVDDKTDPIFACPTAPIEIECFENFNDVAPPTATDNCDGNVTVQQTSQMISDNDPCTPTTVTRTFTAFDASGNQAEPCTQVIELVTPTLPDFPEDITFTCEQFAAFPTVIEAETLNPAITDSDLSDDIIDVAANTSAAILANTGAGLPDVATGTYCQYGISFNDNVIETCGDNFKIIRTFTVLNWCTNTLVTTDINGDDNVQVIKIDDTTPPTVTRADFTVSANNFANHPQPCSSTAFLLPATFSDNCSGIAEVEIFTPVGEAIYPAGQSDGSNGGFIPSPGLSIGEHPVLYRVTDECGLETTISVMVTVVDDLSPTVVCDEITTTVLNGNGLATINAATFDDGSNDNCGIPNDGFAVRRMTDPCNIPGNTSFGPSVTFCCIDAAQASVQVQLQVTDFFGNSNSCMVQVIVEDNTPPTLVSCPPTQTITCDFFNDNIAPALATGDESVLDQFGEAVFDDACLPMPTDFVNVDVDNCGEGTITRVFNATDAFGNNAPNCTQTINVVHVSDFVVEFPADMDFECQAGQNPTEDGDFGQPTVFFDDCEMVATSFDDQVFTITNDACYKIFRTWTVINWCVYDDFGFDAVSESPEIDLPGGSLDPDGDKDARTYRDGLNITNFPNAMPDGYIQHIQVIKIQDNVAPVIENPGTLEVCITENACATTVNLPEGTASDCSPNVTFTATSDFGVGFGPFINVAPGNYSVTYTATDNCGNSSSTTFEVNVSDCKAPTPYCVGGLIIELSPIDTDGDGSPDAGEAESWANDFDAGSFDNCTADENLTFSFSQNAVVQGVTYTCDSIGQRPVFIWITDEAGNQDVCQTTVQVESVDNVCNANSPQIAGFIQREDGEGVLLTEVMVSGNGNNMDMSNDEGYFEVMNLEEGYDYSVVPSKNDTHDLGVTTLDLVLIRRHVLNTELLDSPYKIIAADANNNEAVTTADIVEIRKLILTTIDAYTNNTSWRFVDKYFQFPNPENPWETDFPEFRSYNNLDYPVYAADFVGVKIGDVNNSAVVNLTQETVEERSSEQLVLATEDYAFAAGETFTVEVGATDAAQILGMQWSLDFNPEILQLDAVTGVNHLRERDFGLKYAAAGKVNHSFVNETDAQFKAEEVLFKLTFTAFESGKVSNFVTLHSDRLRSEAYLTETETAEVILEFNGANPVVNTDSATLFQNNPNPFSAGTEIAFYLPEAATAKLSIFDAAGKLLWTRENEFAAGRSTVGVSAEELSATGVLYYRLETEGTVLTRKMIKLR